MSVNLSSYLFYAKSNFILCFLHPTHKVDSSLGTCYPERLGVIEAIIPAGGGLLFDALYLFCKVLDFRICKYFRQFSYQHIIFTLFFAILCGFSFVSICKGAYKTSNYI